MVKINRSELWAKVKSIGNYGSLRWQSKTAEWQAFIEDHETYGDMPELE